MEHWHSLSASWLLCYKLPLTNTSHHTQLCIRHRDHSNLQIQAKKMIFSEWKIVTW